MQPEIPLMMMRDMGYDMMQLALQAKWDIQIRLFLCARGLTASFCPELSITRCTIPAW